MQSKLKKKLWIYWGGGGCLALLVLTLATHGGLAQVALPPDRPPAPGSLKTVQVPLPPNLSIYVVDESAAIALGKALFWDERAGSDGLACASCHFAAGADNRTKNQLNPGLRNETNSAINHTYNLTASNGSNLVDAPPGGGPNYTMKKLDFPFHQLADIADRDSAVLFDTDDVMSSQGVYQMNFVDVGPSGTSGTKKYRKPVSAAARVHVGRIADDPKPEEPSPAGIGREYDRLAANARRLLVEEFCSFPTTLNEFNVAGVPVRQVEPRNTPTVINAIFNFRNFWDMRANNIFNGRNPFGMRDPTAGIDPANSILVDIDGVLVPEPVIMPDASLASQAVGPPLSGLEMSCSGRLFEDIGKKLLAKGIVPLGNQNVDKTDSVLGPYAKAANGLSVSYNQLIRKAFSSKYWSSNKRFVTRGVADSQMEKNFSLFWALSIMLYESTLVSDNSPFDQFKDGNPAAISTAAINGFEGVFMTKGQCIFCHQGPEFTSAGSSHQQPAKLSGGIVEHMIMGDGNPGLYDTGAYNIGVRSPVEDIGVGGSDPWGNPLSLTRQAKIMVDSGTSTSVYLPLDNLFVNTCSFQVLACTPITTSYRDAVDGSFKVPTLRNVELTGPYFHNGSRATLDQVLEFYNRGGDRTGPLEADSSGYGPNPTNLDVVIQQLGLTPTDIANLKAFLLSLTDERVRWERAPFDHPQLHIPNGSPGNETQVTKMNPGTRQGASDFITLPAVGASGRSVKQGPVKSFDAGLK